MALVHKVFNLKISFFRALHAYQSAESILRKYKFNITWNSVKKHDTLLQKMQLRGTARCKRAEACFNSVPVARNARLVRCLIKSVTIVNKSVRKPPLNIHTQNSDPQKLRDVPSHLHARVHPGLYQWCIDALRGHDEKIFVNRELRIHLISRWQSRGKRTHKYINPFLFVDTRARTRNQSPLHALEWLVLLVKHRIRAN